MKIAIIGAGNMGGATARGLAQSKHVNAKDIFVSTHRKGKLDEFMLQHVNEDLQGIMIILASEMAKKCKAKEED